jgi:hypothetical protein
MDSTRETNQVGYNGAKGTKSIKRRPYLLPHMEQLLM